MRLSVIVVTYRSTAALQALLPALERERQPDDELIVVDGVVDLARTRARLPDKPESFFIKPAGVAETTYQLSQQDPSAWSFEVEARPFGEAW